MLPRGTTFSACPTLACHVSCHAKRTLSSLLALWSQSFSLWISRDLMAFLRGMESMSLKCSSEEVIESYLDQVIEVIES